MEIDDAANPLIWTSQGYVREQAMRHEVRWDLVTRLVKPPRWQFWKMGVGHPVLDQITCVRLWFLGDVMVKESRDVFKNDGGVMADAQTEGL